MTINYERFRKWVQNMDMENVRRKSPRRPGSKPDIDSITQQIYDELNTEEKEDDKINPL